MNGNKHLAVVSRNNKRLTLAAFPATLRAMSTAALPHASPAAAPPRARWATSVCVVGLLCVALNAGTAQAAPAAGDPAAAPVPDVLGELLQERGLLGQAAQAGQRMGQAASELVVHAMGFLGVPYKLGGQSVETGFDCSGFVRAVYEQTVGLVLPRTAHQQANNTQTIQASELKPGDLVFFNTLRRSFSHVGIYIGEGRFIHSPRPGAEVRVEDMKVNYWRTRFDGARRVLTTEPAELQASPPPPANPMVLADR